MVFRYKHIWLLIAAAVLLSIQILAVVIYIYSFIPLHWDDSFLKGLEPTRDSEFYAIFLVANVLLVAAAVKWVLPKLEAVEFRRRFALWIGLDVLWCFLILFCFFKWTTYRYPFWNIIVFENNAWLRPFFCTVCILAAVSKIFFPEVEKFYNRMKISAGHPIARPYRIAFQAGILLFLSACLYIPQTSDVVALAFAWDQFNHLDQVAGWFIKKGWYLQYDQVINVLVMAAITYVTFLFYFIRRWLNSLPLAAIGALLTVKLGLFYYATSPNVWINPGNSFLAHGWDIILFFMLWRLDLHSPKQFYPVCCVLVLLLLAGWVNSNGYLAALGLDNQPFMAPLRVRQFFPYFMGYFIPVFYVFSLLSARDRFIKVLCIYGLLIFVDYIEHPAVGFYGSLMVPAILIGLWWAKQMLGPLNLSVKRQLYAAVLLLTFGALVSNRLMLTYPNAFFHPQRFERERVIYRSFDVLPSAALIEELVPQNQEAVVLSNFETALLMRAHRRPLFKDFPVMFSSSSGNPAGLRITTKKQGLQMINSMEHENAAYVFVDERIWSLPPQALGSSGLNVIMGYVRDHYQPYAQRGFLTALQRK